MISIIICSRFPQKNQALVDNINTTIGNILFEIIWIDNSNNHYNIFSAYNKGIELAKYDILCFMHEDVFFLSNNWGEISENMLSDKTVGILGLIGTHYLSKFSTYWLASDINHGRIIQGYEDKSRHRTEEWNWNKRDKYSNRVVAIDGLWMCCRKEIFSKNISFDDKTYSGFHFYDMDISMQVIKKGYKILIADDILVEHTSESFSNQSFTDACITFHRKWNDFLPVMSETISIYDIRQFELTTVFNACNNSLLNRELSLIVNSVPHRILQKIILFLNKWTKK